MTFSFRQCLGITEAPGFHANAVELQWLERLWNYENMLETGVVIAYEN